MNSYLHKMQLQLQVWTTDYSGLLAGETLFDDVDVHKYEVYESLFKEVSSEFDTITQMALEVLMHSLLLILERQAKDQLPGGKYWNPSKDTCTRAAHVGATNTVSERDFGQLDLLVRTKPVLCALKPLCYGEITRPANGCMHCHMMNGRR